MGYLNKLLMVTEHYYKEETEIELQLGLVSAWIREKEFEFYTSPPVFSWRKIDKGTLVLAENMKFAGSNSLLDLGCGYGVLGIVAAFFNPTLKVAMIEKSKRAAHLASLNVEKYVLKTRVEVINGNLYEPLKPKTPEEKAPAFDVIVSNPPYSAGKEVVNSIIEQAPKFLNKNGSLQIVGRKQKGGEMYAEKMSEVFGNCEEFGIKSGFRVYMGVK